MAQVQPLDPATWATVTNVVAHAQVNGLNVAEELNRKGLIMSPHARLAAQKLALSRLAELLRLWRPSEMIRRRYDASHSTTPAEMYDVVTEFVEEFRNKLREE